MNPYLPTPQTPKIVPESYHCRMIAFIHLSMFGGIVCIVAALIANKLCHWDATWFPLLVFYAFALIGCYHLANSKSGGKLLIGTLLIWNPYPIHAGVAASTVSMSLMQIREFAFSELSISNWWTVTFLMIAIGWGVTTWYLQFSRRRIEATIGIRFAAISWGSQVLVAAAATQIL